MTSGDEAALIEYLSQEKIQSQSRLKSVMLFCQSVSSGSAILRESLEILRQNAESDYDTILHLLTLLRHNDNKGSVHGSSSSPEQLNSISQSNKKTPIDSSSSSQESIQNDFFMQDPLTEGFEYGRPPSLSIKSPITIIEPILEDEDPFEEDEKEEENNKENEGSSNRRLIRPSKKDTPSFARSLPVNVPLSSKGFMKFAAHQEEEDIPEDLESGIAFIMSLKEKSFDLSDPKFSFRVE